MFIFATTPYDILPKIKNNRCREIKHHKCLSLIIEYRLVGLDWYYIDHEPVTEDFTPSGQ